MKYITSCKVALVSAIVCCCVTTGCSYISIPRVKIEEQVTLTLPAEGARSLDVQTHNGNVEIAANGEIDEFVVVVKKQARARSMERAAECMEAIELITDSTGGRQRLAWKWNTARASDWSASVSFDVEAPARLSSAVKTHNGRITVTGMEGDCHLITHNGRVNAETSGRKVEVETHNGSITLKNAG